jgi:hypothetical protein
MTLRTRWNALPLGWRRAAITVAALAGLAALAFGAFLVAFARSFAHAC